MFRLPGSIRFNLILVVLAGVLPVLAVILASGLERRHHEVEQAQRTTLRLANSLAHQQIAETTRLRTILAALSQNPAVRDLDVAACTRLFQDTLVANPAYVNFALIAADGEALASALPFTRQNLAERREFQASLKTGDFVVGEYTVGKVSGAAVLPFAYPVRDRQEKIIAILIATLRLQELSTFFDQAMLPAGSFVGIADHEGHRLYRYPPLPNAGIGQPIAPGIWAMIQSANPPTIFTGTGSDGTRRIYAVNRVSQPGAAPYLNLFVGIPEKTVLDEADAVTLHYLLWLSASLLLSLGLAWFVGKFGIHDRLEQMAQTAQRIGSGDFSARSGLTETSGSLGVLARAMDRMAHNLEAERSALVAARDALALEAKRRAALMDISGDGIAVIDPEHRVVETNRRFAAMLGYEPAEVIGLHTWEYEASMDEAGIRRHFTPGSHIGGTFETLHRRKDGSLFPVEVSAHGSLVDGEHLIIAVVRDISERKKAERALQESEERYRALFDNSLDAIGVQEGIPPRFTWVNPAFCRLFGYAPEEIYALDTEGLWGLIHADDRDMVRQSLLGRLSGHLDSAHHSFRILTKDGVCRWVDVMGQRLRSGDRPMNMSIYRDITEAHETQELLARAKAQAEAASQAKNDFLANMSHELRTPLNGILGVLQLLQYSSPNERQAEYTRLAIQAGKRLTRLLADMLDISKIEAGKLIITHEPFNLRTAVGEIQELMLPVAAQSGVSCTAVVDARLPDVVLGDSARLQQILSNLVGNALKFTTQGSVVTELYALPAPSEHQCRMLLSVSDTGAGIGDDVLPRLFAPFTQGSQGYRRDHQGAGLGLSICKRLVGLMGGTIAIESEVGRGTTVHVCLTFDLPAAPTASQTRSVVSHAPVARGLTLLLAEDEALTRMATRLILEQHGHTVVVAGSGKAVLARAAGQVFDLILMDVQMPVMDGVEAARRIRDGEAGPDAVHVPIIAMTAYAMESDREAFLAAGMDETIAKPVDMDELFAAIDRIMAGRTPNSNSKSNM